jgi:hypothetical protein
VDGKVPSPLVHISIDDLVPSCTLSLYIRVVCTPDEASRKLTRVRFPYVKPRWARTRPERRPRGRRRLSAPDSATTTAGAIDGKLGRRSVSGEVSRKPRPHTDPSTTTSPPVASRARRATQLELSCRKRQAGDRTDPARSTA